MQIYAVFAAVVALIAWIVYGGFEDTMIYYITVSELQAKGVVAEGDGLRISGEVVKGSVVRADDGLSVEFEIDELGHKMPVVYRGIIPDTFKEGAGVLLEGEYKDGKFIANRVFTKCASKYEKEGGEGQYETYDQPHNES